jgi:hypothetical protein
MDYHFHPLRKGDPVPTESEICARMQDIREHGLIHPIVLYENQILVGRADYLACKRLNIVPRFQVIAWSSNPMATVRAGKECRLKHAAPVPSAVTPKETAQDQEPPARPQDALSTLQRTNTPQLHDGREDVRRLASRIGIRAAAREYGLKESRVLNWAWRDGWHIGKRKHRAHNPVNRCRLCGQPVVSM